jgi:hypothetical protein
MVLPSFLLNPRFEFGDFSIDFLEVILIEKIFRIYLDNDEGFLG